MHNSEKNTSSTTPSSSFTEGRWTTCERLSEIGPDVMCQVVRVVVRMFRARLHRVHLGEVCAAAPPHHRITVPPHRRRPQKGPQPGDQLRTARGAALQMTQHFAAAVALCPHSATCQEQLQSRNLHHNHDCTARHGLARHAFRRVSHIYFSLRWRSAGRIVVQCVEWIARLSDMRGD